MDFARSNSFIIVGNDANTSIKQKSDPNYVLSLTYKADDQKVKKPRPDFMYSGVIFRTGLRDVNGMYSKFTNY